MEIVTETFEVSSKGMSEVVDITDEVTSRLKTSRLQEGSAIVFVSGSTASITTTEFEPGLRQDIPEFLDEIIPHGRRYHHDRTWNDGNGFSHLRAALIGPSLTIPFTGGKLVLGTWQQVILVDHDNRPRRRNITVQFTGQQ